MTTLGVSHALEPIVGNLKEREAMAQEEMQRDERELKVTIEQALVAVLAKVDGRVHEIKTA